MLPLSKVVVFYNSFLLFMTTVFVSRIFYALSGLVLTFLISACSSYAPTTDMTGLTTDQVTQRLGIPATRLSDQDGYILVFTRGPFGKHTYFLYFSPEDKLLRSEQVLTEAKFALIKPGMSKDEVLQLIGPTKFLMGGVKGSWTVWSYRYENSLCRWFQVEFQSDNLVKTAEYGRPPECNVRAPRVSVGR